MPFARYLAQAWCCDGVEPLDGGALEAAPGFDSGPAPADARLPVVACRTAAATELAPALAALRRRLQRAPAGLLVVRQPDVGRCRLEALGCAVAAAGLRAEFLGRCRSSRDELPAALVIVHPQSVLRPGPAPPRFRVLAVVPTYNEEDVIAQTLRYLTAQGIEVHLLDNWSTDATVERARAFLARGLVAIERFPVEGPTGRYELASIMRRVEEIGASATWADWVMLHDADERRTSPWPGVGLRDGLWHAQRSGFTCIDHVTLNFWPVDDAFDPGVADLEDHFRFFEFSNHPGHFHQRRAWRQLGVPVGLADSAGHDPRFTGRRVYPYKFLLKHYPIRSRAHGERKVLRDRASRWSPAERAHGWHQQYDGLAPQDFVRDRRSLLRFDAGTFETRYLIERLSGVGVFERPPSWATAPLW